MKKTKEKKIKLKNNLKNRLIIIYHRIKDNQIKNKNKLFIIIK